MEFLNTVYITAVVLGLFVSCALFKQRHFVGNKILAFLLMLLIITPLNNYLQASPTAFKFVGKEMIMIISHSSILAVGPLVTLFVSQLLLKPLTQNQTLALFLPFVAMMGFKVFANNVIYLSVAYASLSLVLGHYIYNILLLVGFKKSPQAETLRLRQYFWLQQMVIGLFLLTIVKVGLIGSYLNGWSVSYLYWHGADVVISLFIISIAALSITNPETFFNQFKALKQRTLILDDALAKILTKNLEQKMDDLGLHQDSELSLDALAGYMGINRYQLSELLNVHMNISFYQYVNHKRLQWAKLVLVEQSDKNILDIALEAGFNNKNSFNRFFKQQEGMSPSRYRDNKH